MVGSVSRISLELLHPGGSDNQHYGNCWASLNRGAAYSGLRLGSTGRIPAGNLESLVIGRLQAFLSDEGALLSAIGDAEKNGAEQKQLIARGRQISGEFPTLTPDEIRSILLTLINQSISERSMLRSECIGDGFTACSRHGP